MLTEVQIIKRASSIPHARHAFRVAAEGTTSRNQFSTQIWQSKGMWTRVIGDALRRTGEECQIIWLTWVSNRKRLGEQGPRGCQGIDVPSVMRPDDLTIGVIFLDNDYYVIGSWHAVNSQCHWCSQETAGDCAHQDDQKTR